MQENKVSRSVREVNACAASQRPFGSQKGQVMSAAQSFLKKPFGRTTGEPQAAAPERGARGPGTRRTGLDV